MTKIKIRISTLALCTSMLFGINTATAAVTTPGGSKPNDLQMKISGATSYLSNEESPATEPSAPVTIMPDEASCPGTGQVPGPIHMRMHKKDSDDPQTQASPDPTEALRAAARKGKATTFKYERLENESKQIPGNVVEVLPEISTLVYLSNSDVNRIVCSNGDVKDIYFSQEKGVKVQTNGNSAYIKYLIAENPATQKKVYAKVPTEFFIVCGENATYTLVGVPKTIPPQTIQLVNPKDKVKDNLELFSGASVENKIGKTIKLAYIDELPSSFDVVDVKQYLNIYEKIEVFFRRKIIVAGEGIAVKEFVLSVKPPFNTQDSGFKVTEKDFLTPELTKEPYAIALEPTELKGQNKVRLFIVEKSTN